MHVSYTTFISSLHYIENFSTYVVSCGHLHIAYNDKSLHEHREVKMSKGQGIKKTPPLSGTFKRSHGIFHKHCEVKRSRSNQFSREMCLDTLKFHASRITFLTHLFLSYFVYTVRLREKPRKSANFQNAKLPICNFQLGMGKSYR